MTSDQDTMHMLKSTPEAPDLDLTWLAPGTTGGRHASPAPRARPSPPAAARRAATVGHCRTPGAAAA